MFHITKYPTIQGVYARVFVTHHFEFCEDHGDMVARRWSMERDPSEILGSTMRKELFNGNYDLNCDKN